MTHEATTAEAGPVPGKPSARSQQRWRRERRIPERTPARPDPAGAARYPQSWQVAGTPLLARPQWRPADPVPLEAVTLSWHPGPPARSRPGSAAPPRGYARCAPTAPASARTPRRSPPSARPGCWRTACATGCSAAATVRRAPGPGSHLAFGANRYFDLINVSEAVAHETAAWVLAHPDRAIGPRPDELPLRSAIGDPLDLARRSVTTGIATLILRVDREAGTAQMLLHWRDPASVAVNGGLYQVAPAGMFQPSGEARANLANDLSLWRAIAREVSEELLGTSEDYGSDQAPIEYERWPFFAALSGARQARTLRGYWLGAGADPLTLDVDLLTVLVFDAELFDAEFGGLVSANEEGHILAGGTGAGAAAAPGEVGIEFTAANVDRFTSVEAMQPAGAAILRLAWRHRDVLLDG